MKVPSRLKAVNTLLSSIGMQPVSELNKSNPEVAMAINVIDEVTNEVQLEGLYEYEQKDVRLATDALGHIPLPPRLLKIQLPQPYLKTENGKVYDERHKTYRIGWPIRATMTLLVDYGELPLEVSRYVTVRATRIFQDRTLSSPEHHRFTKEDELNALTTVKRVLNKKQNPNILKNEMFKGLAR